MTGGPAKAATATSATDLAAIEATPKAWRDGLFPATYTAPLADYQEDFWAWLWEIVPGQMPRPYVAVWGRGSAKSTNAEAGVVALGGKAGRRYVLYVGGTQSQADDHVQNIASRLESDQVARYYPELADRAIGKFGNPRGWRRNRISTRAGFTVDAIGLDTAARGVKFDDERPDVIVFDDIDAHTDSPETITKKVAAITKMLLPAGSLDVAVMVLQNLVHRNGVVGQIVDGRADFLGRRILSGPHPAIEGLTTEGAGKDAVITGGTPTWAVMGLAECQAKISLFGLNAFLAECQHKVELSGQPRFDLEALAVMRQSVREPLPAKALPAHLQGIEGLRCFALPRPGQSYVLYIDPAEGKGRDYTASGVMEARTRQLVCILEDNFREPQKHADIAADLSVWYNLALTGYERARGEAIAYVLGLRGITRIYQHVDNPLTDQQRANGLKEKRIPGFPMTEHSKRGLTDRFALAVEGYNVFIPDLRTLEQCEAYVVTERMTTEASAGGHDDLVIMAEGCLMLAETPGAQVLGERTSTRSRSYGYAEPGGGG